MVEGRDPVIRLLDTSIVDESAVTVGRLVIDEKSEGEIVPEIALSERLRERRKGGKGGVGIVEVNPICVKVSADRPWAAAKMDVLQSSGPS